MTDSVHDPIKDAVNGSFGRRGFEVRDLTVAGSGAGSRVFRVATDGGTFAAKVAMYPERRDRVIREFEIRRRMAEHGLGFVPRPQWIDEEFFPDGAAVYDYVEGHPLRSAGPVTDEALLRIAEMLANLHLIDFEVIPDGFRLAEEMLDRTRTLVDETIAQHDSLVNSDLRDGLAMALDEIRTRFGTYESSFTIGLIGQCHDDVAGNIVVGPGGKLWLIDWENSCIEDILEELVSVSNDLDLSETQARVFFERYQDRIPAAQDVDFPAVSVAYDIPTPVCNICYSIDFLDVNLRRNLAPALYADSLVRVARSTVGSMPDAVSELLVRGAERTRETVRAITR